MLIVDKELRKKIGDNNRNRVEEYYIDRCALRYEIVFDEVPKMNANTKRAKRHVSSEQAN